VVNILGAKMVRDSYRDAAQTVFGPIEKFLLRHGVQARYQSQAGSPAAGIAKLAKQGEFELIIMGSHGSGGLKSLIMGSVATSVLAQCDTPVLLVR
jgi:nucleotide-binding universal stress UspA family protein